MDMSLDQYLEQLNQAIEAMKQINRETPQAIKDIVYENFWQKQSAYICKVKRQFGGTTLEENIKWP